MGAIVPSAHRYTARMTERRFDPQRLDVAAFARAGGRLRGDWPLAGFARLLQDAHAAAGQAVAWSAAGECRSGAAGPDQTWLHLRAQAEVVMPCQRCLQPMAVALAVDRRFRFVADEAQAERLDADSEDDVLVLEPALDLQALLEDELILALPLVPRHAQCTLPAGAATVDEAAHPFAGLAALRRADRG
jgi:uncharacterized protein